MNSSSIPKTFLIHASYYVNNEEKSGFIRMMSYQDSKGDMTYRLTFVKSKSEASRYLNFDNVKTVAYEYMMKYNLRNVKIIDFINGKTSNVKESRFQEKQ